MALMSVYFGYFSVKIGAEVSKECNSTMGHQEYTPVIIENNKYSFLCIILLHWYYSSIFIYRLYCSNVAI